MKTIYLNEQTVLTEPCVATVGMFDGVHLGHQFLIAHVVSEARRRGLPACVVTFDRQPRQVLQPDWQPQLLAPLDEKLLLLSHTGIDCCVVLPFSVEMAQLSARDFMRDVLRRQLCVDTLFTGYDNRFGHNRSEGFDEYVAFGREWGISVQALPVAPPIDGLTVSSSAIRRCLLEGDVATANRCLGYPYSVAGHVVEGEHIGTHIGFPTANLQPDAPEKLIPAAGAYAVKVRVESSVEHKHGMMNIGHRPTFDGQQTTLETHIFRYNDNLYGQFMIVSLMERLRPEQRFDSAGQLAEQLQRDEEAVEKLFNQELDE